MNGSEFRKLESAITERVSSEVTDMFHKRLAGYALKDCLVKPKLAMSIYLLEDIAAMNYNTADNTALNTPTSVKCSDINITLNKLKSYVFKRR
jgi:hypothetical protein